MPHPDAVIAAIYRAMKADGTWLIKDIRSMPDFKQNMRNPLLAMFYGFSVSACMSSALSEPDGAGLGTLGFNPEVARNMTGDAGFTRFHQHDQPQPTPKLDSAIFLISRWRASVRFSWIVCRKPWACAQRLMTKQIVVQIRKVALSN